MTDVDLNLQRFERVAEFFERTGTRGSVKSVWSRASGVLQATTADMSSCEDGLVELCVHFTSPPSRASCPVAQAVGAAHLQDSADCLLMVLETRCLDLLRSLDILGALQLSHTPALSACPFVGLRNGLPRSIACRVRQAVCTQRSLWSGCAVKRDDGVAGGDKV